MTPADCDQYQQEVIYEQSAVVFLAIIILPVVLEKELDFKLV